MRRRVPAEPKIVQSGKALALGDSGNSTREKGVVLKRRKRCVAERTRSLSGKRAVMSRAVYGSRRLGGQLLSRRQMKNSKKRTHSPISSQKFYRSSLRSKKRKKKAL